MTRRQPTANGESQPERLRGGCACCVRSRITSSDDCVLAAATHCFSRKVTSCESSRIWWWTFAPRWTPHGCEGLCQSL